MERRTPGRSPIEAEAERLLRHRLRALAAQAPRLVDPAASWTDWDAVHRTLSEEERRELAAVEEALGRLAEGRYGTCVACGGPLGLQRIRAIPEARYCLSCSGSPAVAD